MVYLYGNWGMGDTECSPCLQDVQNLQQNNFNHQQTFSKCHTDLLRPLSQNDTESDEDEISLFPLSNQVCVLINEQFQI